MGEPCCVFGYHGPRASPVGTNASPSAWKMASGLDTEREPSAPVYTGRPREGRGEHAMEIRTTHERVTTPDGAMPVYLAEPTAPGRHPAVLVIMEAFGLNAHIEDVARRIAAEGYVALAPDVYWRQLPDNKVGYDELPKAIGLMQKVNDQKVVQDIWLRSTSSPSART
jgi:hypothetical protein